jgi:hypothetical protein
MGYSSGSSPLIAHVVIEGIIKDSAGAVIKTIKFDYWEYFKMDKLPDTKEKVEDPQIGLPFDNVKKYANKPFYATDVLQSLVGSFLEGARPDSFSCTLNRTHELFASGTITGEMDDTGNVGKHGILAKDVSGNGPVITRTEGTNPPQDLSGMFIARRKAQGQVTKAVDKVITIKITHESSWRKKPSGKYSVDWKYSRDIESAAGKDKDEKSMGADDVEPKADKP